MVLKEWSAYNAQARGNVMEMIDKQSMCLVQGRKMQVQN